VGLGVGHPGAVINRGVEVVAAGAGSAVCVATAPGPLAASCGDPSELFHVDVNEVAGRVVLVAHRRAGGPVEAVEAGEPRIAYTVERASWCRAARRCGPRRSGTRSAQTRSPVALGVQAGPGTTASQRAPRRRRHPINGERR
jgi:hypothetical protein